MLSLTKRSEVQPVAAPLWHPNFRDYDRLPDTKVVRTTFFINTAAIGLSLGLLMWFGYREYHIYSLNEHIAEAQREIDSNSRQNKEALRLSQIFAEEQKKLDEAEVFLRSPISPLEFLTVLGQTLPKEISIESLDSRLAEATGATFVLRGLVAGTPDQASGTASSYVDMLRGNKRLAAVFASITLTNLNRDQGSGLLAFEINFKAKNSTKEK